MTSSIARGPVRVSATIPHPVAAYLEARAQVEGRSLSNLIAFLLELEQERGSAS